MGLLMNRFVSQTITFYLAKITPEDLTVLKELAEAGKLKSVIDRTYALSEVSSAISYLAKGHARGKVVITV
jgi:NADPH:quinone reductase-like Zn-dependent oxidoreductase